VILSTTYLLTYYRVLSVCYKRNNVIITVKVTINWLIILFTMTYASIFSARIVNIWNSLPNSVVVASTFNAFKARLDKFWSHQAVKYDFTADLTGTGNRSKEVLKSQSFY